MMPVVFPYWIFFFKEKRRGKGVRWFNLSNDSKKGFCALGLAFDGYKGGA
jgi:hypothetical protein